MRQPITPCVYESYYHTASPEVRKAFAWVMRAGHLQAGANDVVRRSQSFGHDWLFCIRGRGVIGCEGRTFTMSPGQFGWIRGSRPHHHIADSQAPWQLLWLRVDGPGIEAASTILSVSQAPIFDLDQPRMMRQILRRILALLHQQPPAVDALIHAQIARALAIVTRTRAAALHEQLIADPGLAASVTQMRLYPARPWRIADLARLAHTSQATYFRAFRRLMRTTPMEYLRRIRIHQAMHRLTESNEPIKQIAAEVGYRDPLHFSREFHRAARMSPSQFRKIEKVAGSH